MPTRIRVILQNNTGTTLFGKRAVSYMWEHVPAKEKKAIVNLPTRTMRLRAIMAFLPPVWVLTLVRETKRTRKNKSLYWKIRELQVPQAQQVEQVGLDVVAMARAALQQAQVRPVNRDFLDILDIEDNL
jgi:hypothetical protein